MTHVNVVYSRRLGRWVAILPAFVAIRRTPIERRTKWACVHAVAKWAKAQPFPVSVRIHHRNGTFAEERTYPRSADPIRSPG